MGDGYDILDNIEKTTIFAVVIAFSYVLKIDSFTILQPLRREMRFTKIDIKYPNESIGTVMETTIKQFYDKQAMTIHFELHKKIFEFHGKFIVHKCKEHYIDCENVVSYDVCDLCSKLNVIFHFAQLVNDNEVKKCPLYGEYYVKNFTVDADKFATSFSFPTEKWWENYWKCKIVFYYNTEIVTIHLDFYFLQFRSRKRQQ